jgi:hypothetical protein
MKSPVLAVFLFRSDVAACAQTEPPGISVGVTELSSYSLLNNIMVEFRGVNMLCLKTMISGAVLLLQTALGAQHKRSSCSSEERRERTA